MLININSPNNSIGKAINNVHVFRSLFSCEKYIITVRADKLAPIIVNKGTPKMDTLLFSLL